MPVNEQDLVILKQVQDGAETVPEVVDATSLTRRQVNYSLEEKLEPAGYVEIERRDGWETTEKDGTEITHWARKRLAVTDEGMVALHNADIDVDMYQAMSHDELVREHIELRERVTLLERKFATLAKRYRRLLEED